MLDLGATPSVGCLISVELLDQMFQRIAEDFSLGSAVSNEPRITARLDTVELRMLGRPEAPHLGLRVSGKWTRERVDLPLDAVLEIEVDLVDAPAGDSRPRLTLSIGTVIEIESPDISESEFIEQFVRAQVGDELERFALDVMQAPITALDSASGGSVSAGLALGLSSQTTKLLVADNETVDAVAIIIGLPIRDPDGSVTLPPRPSAVRREFIPDARSFLPSRLDLCVFYNQALMDVSLRLATSNLGNLSFPPAVIDDLDLTMRDNDLDFHLAARVEVSGFADQDVSVDGPIRISMPRGWRTLNADTFDLDVSLPDRCTIGFAKVILRLDLNVPSELAVQLTIKQQLEQQMAVFGQGFDFPETWLTTTFRDAVSMLNTPDHSEVRDGNLLLFGHGFITPFTAEITMAYFHFKRRVFYAFELNGARTIATAELARMMDADMITVPGHHAVQGSYIRANPDSTSSNNLMERFAPRHV